MAFFVECGSLFEERKAMPSIRIVKVPPGFAPELFRRDWVGVEIPLATAEELERDPPSRVGIGSENEEGYCVLRVRAIEALIRMKRLPAAGYWKYVPDTYLVFHKDVCKLIE